eukprot:jgi/Hompol1/5548/HPOL_004532-RA
MSISINDDHIVAAGTATGKILIYDVRMKAVIEILDTLAKSNVSRVYFQPPKWATDVAIKEPPIVPKQVVDSGDGVVDTRKAAVGNEEFMNVFSPVHTKGVQRAKSQDLGRAIAASKVHIYC